MESLAKWYLAGLIALMLFTLASYFYCRAREKREQANIKEKS